MSRRDKGKYRGPERTPDDAKLAAIEWRAELLVYPYVEGKN